MVDRREAMKLLAAGSTAFLPLSQLSSPAVVQGAAAAASADKWAPRFLSSREDELVTTLAELILPETDTPGARAAQVNRHFDLVLDDETPTVQRAFRDGLRWVEAASRERFNANFVDAGEQRQIELLTEMSESSGNIPSPGHAFFRDIRERTVFAYYTSKIGIHDELEYKGKTPARRMEGLSSPRASRRRGRIRPRAQRGPGVSRKVYDVLIVGSGASGGIAAKVLAEHGLETLLLEAGPTISRADYLTHSFPYDFPFRGRGSPSKIRKDGPMAARESTPFRGYYAELSENPYTTPPDNPFDWSYRSRILGGRTLHWGRQSLRFADFDFKPASMDGEGIDWPFSYQDLEPYYDKVEEYIGVQGFYEGLSQIPDGKFQPAFAYNCFEHLMRKAARKMDRRLTACESPNSAALIADVRPAIVAAVAVPAATSTLSSRRPPSLFPMPWRRGT